MAVFLEYNEQYEGIEKSELDFEGKKYRKINNLWHFYYPLANGRNWHYVRSYEIRDVLKKLSK